MQVIFNWVVIARRIKFIGGFYFCLWGSIDYGEDDDDDDGGGGIECIGDCTEFDVEDGGWDLRFMPKGFYIMCGIIYVFWVVLWFFI